MDEVLTIFVANSWLVRQYCSSCVANSSFLFVLVIYSDVNLFPENSVEKCAFRGGMKCQLGLLALPEAATAKTLLFGLSHQVHRFRSGYRTDSIIGLSRARCELLIASSLVEFPTDFHASSSSIMWLKNVDLKRYSHTSVLHFDSISYPLLPKHLTRTFGAPSPSLSCRLLVPSFPAFLAIFFPSLPLFLSSPVFATNMCCF